MATFRLIRCPVEEIGISGGEPTLVFEDLLRVVRTARDLLPDTCLHVLTNGRLFAYRVGAERLAAEKHRCLVVGIPIHGDYPRMHDELAGAKGAFEQTVRGILHLGNAGIRLEVRVVVTRQNYRRLGEIAGFIARNMPFAEHVALMGMELVGLAAKNVDDVWVDPWKCQEELEEAVCLLDGLRGPKVSIYNVPLCLLPERLWPYAARSISDWKNVYDGVCDECEVRDRCCGFFASYRLRRSKHVRSLSLARAREENAVCHVGR